MIIITALKYLKAENNYFMRQTGNFKTTQLIYRFLEFLRIPCVIYEN